MSNVQNLNVVYPYAESVTTFGTNVARGETDGFGLVTHGFLWGFYNIWFNQDAHDGLSTTWTNSNASITTTWTACVGGIYGEPPP